jgi:threonine/homoserine/homoserine lactone efflux protein
MMIAISIGTALGFFGAIPVAGPVSALVLRYGLKHQYRNGRALAFGAGLAEAIYVLLAFFGFNVLIHSIPYLEFASKAVTSLILIGLGVYFILARPSTWSDPSTGPSTNPSIDQTKGRSALIIGFGISIVNPTLLATWTTVITTIHGLKLFAFSPSSSCVFALGVWVGITLWFSLMLALIRMNHQRFKTTWIRWLLIGMGVLLTVLGMVTARAILLEVGS